MFDTYVTIVGNVLTTPEWRRTTQSNTLVANFKVASTARRLDRDSGRWVDGNSLRVRVNCWRKLAEGVAASVMVGDPVVVCGRLYTRDWTDDAGTHRTLYELEAVAVGHDLSRGRARFLRNRPSMTTSTVEDAEAESRVHGEPTEPVPAGQVPVLPDDRPLDDDFELPDYTELRTSPFGDGDDDVSATGELTPAGLDDALTSPAEPVDDNTDATRTTSWGRCRTRSGPSRRSPVGGGVPGAGFRNRPETWPGETGGGLRRRPDTWPETTGA
ncbi:single-stranded DNA-binding protein [Micromonospora tarensis]|uniref:Single-stranded DNA-binding protein n=1 Tax=Micromonospora tarensis TaxID=2806100 RepID=A0ABS1YJ30_9ACTN|nr:single-stranded DNA-binding protein [Micromonospora tarensis]MBM0277440.1 single-stranded DNA-binding protein [Micromonospora tarensis]